MIRRLFAVFARKKIAALRHERDRLTIQYARAIRGHTERAPIYAQLKRVNHELLRLEVRYRRGSHV